MKIKEGWRTAARALAAFTAAFLLFHGVQSWIFPQSPSQAKAFHKAANTDFHATLKPSEDKPAQKERRFDRAVDNLVTHLSERMSRLFGTDPGNSSLLFGVALLLLLLVSTTGIVLKFLVLKPLLHLWRKSLTTEKEKDASRGLSKGIISFFVVLGLRLAIVPVETYFHQKLNFLRSPASALLVLLGSLIAMRIAIAFIAIGGARIARRTESNVDDQLIPIFLGITRTIFVIFGTLFSLSTLGMNMAPIIASLGAASFALGFAVKDSLSNFVGGIFLVLEQAFVVGDKVDIPGIGIGTIDEIGLRTTKMLTPDHEIIVIPNNVLMNKHFKNYRLPTEKIRVIVPFAVAYGSDVDQVRYLATQVANSIAGRSDEEVVAVDFKEMGQSSLNFELKFHIMNYKDQNGKRLEAVEKLYRALRENNIQIPFPTVSVEMKKEG